MKKMHYALKGGLNDETCENDKTEMFTKIKEAMKQKYIKEKYHDNNMTFDNANINGWVKKHFAHWESNYPPILSEYTKKCETVIVEKLKKDIKKCINNNISDTDILKSYVENCDKDSTSPVDFNGIDYANASPKPVTFFDQIFHKIYVKHILDKCEKEKYDLINIKKDVTDEFKDSITKQHNTEYYIKLFKQFDEGSKDIIVKKFDKKFPGLIPGLPLTSERINKIIKEYKQVCSR